MALTQVSSAGIKNAEVKTEDILDANITTAKIANDAVTAAKIADDTITQGQLANSSVGTGELAADAVTGAKIADDAINSEHYTDGSIDTAHIADLNVTTAKIAADAITGAKIADDAVGAEHIEQLDADLSFADNVNASFGAGADLKIDHTGTDSVINNATGHFYIQGENQLTIKANNNVEILKATGDEAMAKFIPDGAVELYHNNTKTFATDSVGCKVIGGEGGVAEIGLQADEGDDNADRWRIQVSDGGPFSIGNKTSGAWEKNIECNGDGNVELYYNSNISLETSAGGIRTGMGTWGSDPSASNHGAALYSPNQGGFLCAAGGTTNSDHALFFNPNGIVGRIRTNGSGTSFLTSSDYRLKENQVAISDGITRLKQLKPYRFNFKADVSKTVDGFFAHEVSPTVPEAITGEKDAVESEDNDKRGIKKGDIIPQGIDQAKLVPLLTAALQEAITKIETLETKVAALEAK